MLIAMHNLTDYQNNWNKLNSTLKGVHEPNDFLHVNFLN